MRVALRIVSVLTILCILGGLAFLSATAGTGGDMSPYMFYGIGFIALGVLVALVTAILGIIASAIGRQFAWLAAMIVATLIPVIGIPVVETLAGQVVDPTTANFLTGTVFGALVLGGPILVALVVFIYSFRTREPAAVGAPPQAPARFR